MGEKTDTKQPGKRTPAKKSSAKRSKKSPTQGPQVSPQQRAAGNAAMADQSAQAPVTSPSRIAYGSTELSQEAIRVRRANPTKSGDQNLVVVKYSVRVPGASGPPTEVIASIWNSPTVAHSEQELPRYFDKVKEQFGSKAEITVHGIFSERQFCGPSGQDCQHLINTRYPAAQKEFAYNYQMPPGIPKREGENTRNVIRDRIEAFRDGGKDVDESTRRDPPPYEERAQGRIASQVVPLPKKSGGGTEGGAAPAQAEPAAGTPAPAKPAAETPAKPTADTPAKPTPETPARPTTEAPAKPTTETPAKPTPETPAKPTSDTPAAPKPSPAPSGPAPSKPSASKPATAKPAVSEPATSEPAASKTAGKSTAVSEPGPGKAGGAAMKAATGTTGAVMAKALGQLSQLSAQSQDKELASAVNALNKAMDVKSFVDDPTRFAADKVKAEIIQGVFSHFSRSVVNARQSFESRFPDVSTLRADPTGNGVSLEQHRKNYRQAVAAMRLPDARKALVYTAVALSINENTPAEEVERRIAMANRDLARLPGLEKYAKNFYAARDRYSFAIAVVFNRVSVHRDDYPHQSAAMVDDLNRRAETLERIASIFDNTKQQLWESGLVAFAPVLNVAFDMETLADGFKGLGGQLRSFANMVGSRLGEYDRELSRLDAESNFMARQAVRLF